MLENIVHMTQRTLSAGLPRHKLPPQSDASLALVLLLLLLPFAFALFRLLSSFPLVHLSWRPGPAVPTGPAGRRGDPSNRTARPDAQPFRPPDRPPARRVAAADPSRDDSLVREVTNQLTLSLVSFLPSYASLAGGSVEKLSIGQAADGQGRIFGDCADCLRRLRARMESSLCAEELRKERTCVIALLCFAARCSRK
jgi:hypothetical protein